MILYAANFVEEVDLAFYVIYGMSILLLLLMTAFMVWAVVKFNKKKHPKPEHVPDNTKLEVTWTVIPVILVFVMFYYGWAGYQPMRDFPDQAITIDATGRMFDWSFKYENGKANNELIVPVGQNVIVNLYSPDVLHSLYIPAFRLKEDVVPGVDNRMWFQAMEEGTYDIFCAEYCGASHSYMLSKVKVLSQADYDAWLAEVPDLEGDPAAAGEALLQQQGCQACHSYDGTARVGPTFKGLWNSTRVVVTPEGATREVRADEAYITAAIYKPNDQVVQGFNPNMMQSYDGRITQEQVAQIIEYLKSLE